MLINIEYSLPLFLPLYSLFAGIGLHFFYKNFEYSIQVIPVLFVISILANSFFIYKNVTEVSTTTNSNPWLSESEYNSGLWIESKIGDDRIFFDSSIISYRMNNHFDINLFFTQKIFIEDEYYATFFLFEDMELIDKLTYQKYYSFYGGSLYTNITYSDLQAINHLEQAIIGQPNESDRIISIFNIKYESFSLSKDGKYTILIKEGLPDCSENGNCLVPGGLNYIYYNQEKYSLYKNEVSEVRLVY